MNKEKPYSVEYLILNRKTGSHPESTEFATIKQCKQFIELVLKSYRLELRGEKWKVFKN